MKKFKLMIACMLFMLLAIGSQAQAAGNYFVGKWSVKITGTPNGDSKMDVVLERKDGKLTGVINMPQGDPAKITEVEETDTTVKLYFNAGGYDIFLNLKKKDETHIEGMLIDQFDAKGERIVENKQ